MIRERLQKLYVWYRLFPAAVFLYIVFYPFLANLVASNTELLDNRPLKAKPTELTRDFAKEFEAYYNDTFAGRKKLLKKYGKIQYKLGIDNGITIQGQKGWAFYDSAKVPDGYTLIDYFGEVRFSEDELRQMASGVEKAPAVLCPARHRLYDCRCAEQRSNVFGIYAGAAAKTAEIGAVAHGFGGGISAETHQG